MSQAKRKVARKFEVFFGRRVLRVTPRPSSESLISIPSWKKSGWRPIEKPRSVEPKSSRSRLGKISPKSPSK